MRPDFDVIRDPLWDNIRLDRPFAALVDTPTFQRLRYVRQLGHAFLVYPGATHSRFEHALGTFHLCRTALGALEERGELDQVPAADRDAVLAAALLHDIGHYPFSHGLEEAGFPHHELLGVRKLGEDALGERLRAQGGDALITRIGAMMQGRSDSPLAGLISGSLDLDKIDYLSRDARNCGVPYGTVDVNRLLAALTIVELDGRRQVGVHEKGVSALESLLFAKYQMYRNVYWHHAVRSATCMFKRAVLAAVDDGAVTAEGVAGATDASLTVLLLAHDPTGLGRAVFERRLHKRALDLPATEVPAACQPWVSERPELLAEVEDRVAAEVGLARHALLIDYPSRASMLAVDLPLRTRNGGVERLTEAGRAGSLGLPRVADELYRSARRFRVFTQGRAGTGLERVLALVTLPEDEVRRRLAEGRPLLG
ncbi:MAG TPA: HD domain-containing protein [Gemmatimonadales bacterium]|nr:HD domain-containing protein [Gemmatimonadales bacterium]